MHEEKRDEPRFGMHLLNSWAQSFVACSLLLGSIYCSRGDCLDSLALHDRLGAAFDAVGTIQPDRNKTLGDRAEETERAVLAQQGQSRSFWFLPVCFSCVGSYGMRAYKAKRLRIGRCRMDGAERLR